MCGIAGIYHYATDQPVSPEFVTAMCDTLRHRGPDDAGVWTDGPIGLGQRRLSIIDLSPLGHQPMATEDERLWITFNGEIYNFQTLRAELEAKGHRFKSQTDTEVILCLYREYGQDCLRHLRGMFAFALWDADRRELFAARDRLGKKPLYYFDDGRRLAFASELKAILQDPATPRQVNIEAFCDYFKYHYVPAPKTIYEGIRKLPAGHCMVCNQEGVRIRSYWDVAFAPQLCLSASDAAEQLRELVRESVAIRMISDVPLGAFLSGGIDSSAVVAMMAGNQSKPVTTCSIGFDVDKYDEIRFARLVAERFRTDHHEFTVRQNALDVIDTVVAHFDEPFADASAVPTYFVSQLARQQVTVALAGDGGDENFAGYDKYPIDAVENRWRSRIPAALRRRLLPPVADLLAAGHHWLLRKATTLFDTLSHDPDHGFFLSSTQFDDRLWNQTLNDATRQRLNGYDPSASLKAHYHRADAEDHLSRILYTDIKTYLTDDILVKVDRMSMAHSLEVRAPLLDHRLVEFVARLPAALKFDGVNDKRILKKAFEGILPADTLYRKKMGFSVPLGQWMRGEFKPLAYDRLIAHPVGVLHFFDPRRITEIWNLHQSGRRNHGAVLWSLLMFELWFRKYMK